MIQFNKNLTETVVAIQLSDYFMVTGILMHCFFVAVIRSGDYYMFDEDTDKEDTESIEPLDMADSLQYSSDDDDKGKIDPLKVSQSSLWDTSLSQFSN